MTIKVYQSLVTVAPVESHEWTGTFADWLASKGVDYLAWEHQPIALTVNGQVVSVDDWATLVLADSDDVEVRPYQHGGVFKALGSIIGAIFGLAFGWLLPSKKHRRYDTPEGKRLETVQATANTAKLGEAVPELAGRFRRFPDYLTPPRRYFANPREQWLEFLACVGPGQYQINSADVKVGDTPIASLGADGSYQIFGPNANLSSVTTHQHWHTVDEVGGTSSGTAGLELSTEYDNRVNVDSPSYVFNGLTIKRTAGEWPVGWGNGTQVSIHYPRQYVIEKETIGSGDDYQYYRNKYTGYFGHIDLSTLSKTHDPYTYHAVVISGSGGHLTIGFYSNENSRWYEDDLPRTITQSYGDGSPWVINTIDGDTINLIPKGSFSFESNATVSDAKVAFSSTAYGEWAGEFVATPGNETTSTIEFDVFFPTGLGKINDDGGVSNQTVSIEFQYRNLLSNITTSVQRSYTRRTLDQLGFTERISVPAGRYACRMRRIGAASTSTQVQDTVHWYGLKCRLPTKTRYPNWTTISIKLRSGGKIAAQSENKINVVATRILPTLQSNGTWSTPQPTRDISAFVRYIAHSIGYTDANIDMPELRRLHNIWRSRGETVDHVFDLTTVKAALQVVLGAGMSELTIANGLIRPVRDDVRTQFESGYSPQNMTKPLVRSFKAKRHDDADGVVVEYIDSESWTTQPVTCAFPNSQRLKLETLKLSGVTSRTRAWRIGMRRMRQIAYQNWEYSFETELDALNSEYLSYVPLLDDLPGYGQSALLTRIEPMGNDVMLTVSEPIEWQDGQNHVVAYRRADGTLAGPWTATQGHDEYTIIAPIPIADRPSLSLKMELPHVYIGTTERWSFPALITEISPRGTDTVSVSAVNYDARIYADDNKQPPIE